MAVPILNEKRGGISSKFPTARNHPHIMASHGADSNILKFYSSRYSADHNSIWPGFKGKTHFRHKGTGYSANLRPQIYYSRRLDELDNPFMAQICKENYGTIFKKSYLQHSYPDGKESFPFDLHQTESGFTNERAISVPYTKDVYGVHINTRIAPFHHDILPKYLPHLHKINSKDPTQMENFGHGPKFMVSETKTKFTGEYKLSDTSRKSVGRIEDTGHTHNNPNVNTVQHIPMDNYKNDLPGYITNRPTGNSLYTTDYDEKFVLRNDVPNLSGSADYNTGSTRENCSVVPHWVKSGDCLEKSTVYKGDYLGNQHPDPSLCDKLGRTHISEKQISGSSHNADPFVLSRDDPQRFTTHYLTKFTDTTVTGKDREGHVRGSVQNPWADGYTKSEGLHTLGKSVNTTDALRSMEQYQARSIKARDKFYDDHTHDSKMLISQPAKAKAFGTSAEI